MNEHKQEIVMKLEQLLMWKEPRIVMNESDPFWAIKKSSMALQGKFVEDCLWTPKLYFTGVDKITSYNPTPTNIAGSPLFYYLYYAGDLVSWLGVSKLTMSCGMEFSWYPFDLQVIRLTLRAYVYYMALKIAHIYILLCNKKQ